MTEPTFAFVRRGYDPVQVDDTVAQLQSTTEDAKAQSAKAAAEVTKLRNRVLELEALTTQIQQEADGARVQGGEPSYDSLGKRISTMLTLAQEEADDLVNSAQARADQLDQETNARAQQITAQAEQQASDLLSQAEIDAARLAQESRREADGILEQAEEQASARIQEAEAHFENRRAVASQQASEFERTLSERRERAAEEFQQSLAQQEAQVAAVQAEFDAIQADAERTRREAEDEAAMMIRNAKSEADQVLRAARERADHVKATSDRELAAATARRDSITAQLANVRQMLSTLGGGAASMLEGIPSFDDRKEAPSVSSDVPVTVVEFDEVQEVVYDVDLDADLDLDDLDDMDELDDEEHGEPAPKKKNSEGNGSSKKR